MIISKNMLAIRPSITLEITARAKALKAQGKDIISLSIGEPDFSTPEIAQESGIKAIKDCDDKYPPASGTDALKNEIVKKLKKDNNLDYKKSEITIGNGAKQIIFNAFFVLLNPGDEVLLPAPYWVSYFDMAKIPGGVPITVNCDENFKIDLADLEAKITSKTKILVLNSPNNPSGACYTKEDIAAVAKVLLKHPNIFIISDDIYEHIIYDGKKFFNIVQVEPQLKDRTIVINGVSKCYAMTGWRIGYAAISHPKVMEFMNTLQTQTTGGVCSIAQAAAVGAFKCDDSILRDRCAIFQSRRDKAIEILANADLVSCNKADGAFYLFPSCKAAIGKKTLSGKIISDDLAFVEYLLDEYFIATVPGSDFGLPGHFRMSYALSTDLLTEACNRIVSACKTLM